MISNVAIHPGVEGASSLPPWGRSSGTGAQVVSLQDGRAAGVEKNSAGANNPWQQYAAEDKGAVSDDELQQAVTHVQDFIQSVKRDLSFSIDEQTGQKLIKVIDPETDKVVRQIPPEDFVSLSKKLGELQGMFFQDRA